MNTPGCNSLLLVKDSHLHSIKQGVYRIWSNGVLEWMNRCNYGQICNVFASRGNKNRRRQIGSFSVFGPNTPTLQYSNTPDLHPTLPITTHRQGPAKEQIILPSEITRIIFPSVTFTAAMKETIPKGKFLVT